MKIPYLELKNYIRMELNNINLFKYSPNKQIQIIIGANGCGKSSLIDELSPLPANHNDYREGGYKLIKITHNGSEYELLSDFTNGRKHSFLKDGVQLNDGRTITIQKELVKQHFGYDQDIHGLLTGNEKFHLMSSARRREWFIRICTVNYDYAVKVFGKLKETLNYTTGALKNYRKRLVEEQNKLISTEKYEEYLGEKQTLIKVLEELFSVRGTPNQRIDQTREKLSGVLTRIIKLSNQFLKMDKRNEFGIHFKSKEDIDEYAGNIYVQMKLIENKLEEKVIEYDKSSKLLEFISNGDQSTLTEIRDKLKPLYEEISILKNNKGLNLSNDNPQRTIDTIDLIEPIITEIFSDINLEYKNSNIQLMDRFMYERDEQKEALVMLKRALEKINSDIRHMEHQRAGEAIECPQCRHRWVVGYSEESYNALKNKLPDQILLIENKEKEILAIEDKVSNIKDYLFRIDRYRKLTSDYDILNSFWNFILVNGHLNNPMIIIKLLNQYKMELYTDLEIKQKEDSISKLNELYQKLIDENISNVEELKNQILKLETDIENETRKLTELREKHTKLFEYSNYVRIGQQMVNTINDLETQIQSCSKEILDSIKTDIINKHISNFQVQLAQVEKNINQYSLQKGIIKDIEDNIAKLEKEEQCTKYLIKELSPTEGLIAEGLHGFIVRFTDSLNKTISKVWTYPLEVLPCANIDDSSVELDYKFPIVVNGGKPKDDVSHGSTAMKEIINLGFRLTAIKYLNFSNAWLSLDEFSSSMDNTHRLNVIDLLKSLMNFSQLFIVNHFYNSYTSFNDAEICALSTLNIVLPEKYNTHVEMS